MSEINPQAVALNDILEADSPAIYDLLSERGKGSYYPKEGILKQSADARETTYNATIGMTKEDDGTPARLPSIGKYVDLREEDSVTYAPSAGKQELREFWKGLLFGKNPTLKGKEISTPISTAGLTHGLYLLGYLFVEFGDQIVIPDKFWGNYRLIFEKGYGAIFNTFPMFKDDEFNVDGFSYTMETSSDKLIVLLNFPNNPTGYTPSTEEVTQIRDALLEQAENGKEILVILDDAYFGLYYEDGVYEESIFSLLVDLHQNILVAKVDGGSKEDYVLGFRTGFVTFGIKGLNEDVSDTLELKMSGAVRGTISSAPNISQSILLNALQSPTYSSEKREKYNLLKSRFDKVKEVFQNEKYKEYFKPLPFNSGYFMCIQLNEDLNGEEVRQILLNEYSTGVIVMGDVLRIAYSSVPQSKIAQLFQNIYDACESLDPDMVMNDFEKDIDDLLANHRKVDTNPSKWTMIEKSLENKDAITTSSGALATWNAPTSTGRSPKDTYLVKRSPSSEKIDWTSPNNLPLLPDTFDMLVEDMLEIFRKKKVVLEVDRVIGADPKYALPVTVVTDNYLTAAFVDNMFKEVPQNIKESVFSEKPFTILVLPNDKVKDPKYEDLLRDIGNGSFSDMVIATDLERNLGIVYGSEYCGSVKKLMFTVMNYLLPDEGILPLHCSANESEDGQTAVLLGLSGTGKTTLSTDSTRKMIGDDEHGWSDNGIANFENGLYAKLIHLDPQKEPDIYNAVFTNRSVVRNGVIIENAMVYPDGKVDVNDDRYTPNSRASFPLRYLDNIKEGSVGGHPNHILFLTADANGVIPPVAKLEREQAMLWFLMGYTSKLAGTEAGVTEPKTVFSRFFGEPFMPRDPNDYISLLGEKIDKNNTKVYLVNTGWSGGPYGVGQRMDIMLTRMILKSIFDGSIEDAQFIENEDFHLLVPDEIPGVDSTVLDPASSWDDLYAYRERVDKLTSEFAEHFDKAYGEMVDQGIATVCPGK